MAEKKVFTVVTTPVGEDGVCIPDTPENREAGLVTVEETEVKEGKIEVLKDGTRVRK